MKDKLGTIMRKFDILGKEIQFKIENSETYKTCVGGFLTLLLAFVSLGSIYLFGNDIIFKTKPNLIFKKIQLEEYPSAPINIENYFYAMRLVDKKGAYVDDYRYFEPILRYEYYKFNNETLDLDLVKKDRQTLKTCNLSHINQGTLDKEFLETYKCALFKNYSIGGNWDSPEVSVLIYEINKCTAATELKYNITCAKEEELAKRYTFPLFVEIKYQNEILDPTKLYKPVTQALDFISTGVDLDTNKRNLFSYSKSTLKSDIGYLVEDISYENFLQIEKIDTDFNKFIPGSNTTIYYSHIYLTKILLDYDRSYLKVQDIAATVGGFFSITYNVLKFAYYFYIENSLVYYYFQNLFSFYKLDDYGKDGAVEDHLQEMENINIIQFNTGKPNNNAKTKKSDTKNYQVVNINSQNDIIPNEMNKGADTFDRLNMNPTDKDKAKNDSNSKSTPKSPPTLLKARTSIISGGDKMKVGTASLINILNKFDKPKTPVHIDETTLWKYHFCNCFIKKETNANSKMMNNFIYSAKSELDKRYSTVNILALFEQFKVLKQIVLNENQCFMLDHKGKKIITNITNNSDKEFTEAFEEINRKKEEKLVKYLLQKKDLDEGFEETDILLLRSMEDDLQMRIKKRCDIK